MSAKQPSGRVRAHPFDVVEAVGLTLPWTEAAIKYDGSPVLKVRGAFMAGMAMHPSAEPGTLVVRCGLDERQLLLDEAPATYYLTDHYRAYPVVLARLTQVDETVLRDLLSMSWRLTVAKTGPGRPGRPGGAPRGRSNSRFAGMKTRPVRKRQR